MSWCQMLLWRIGLFKYFISTFGVSGAAGCYQGSEGGFEVCEFSSCIQEALCNLKGDIDTVPDKLVE